MSSCCYAFKEERDEMEAGLKGKLPLHYPTSFVGI
jgi:hypothetical protein